jgi:hypothetical protein
MTYIELNIGDTFSFSKNNYFVDFKSNLFDGEFLVVCNKNKESYRFTILSFNILSDINFRPILLLEKKPRLYNYKRPYV